MIPLQILNSNIEIQNKFEYLNSNVLNINPSYEEYQALFGVLNFGY
jgi:hypothetical protein